MARNDLTVERLRELLSYDPDTGVFTWRVDRMSGEFRNIFSARAGDVAGNMHHSGYTDINVDGHQYRAHRLAWLYCFGEWPRQTIDHLDHVRHNNGLGNIRDKSMMHNSWNAISHRTTNLAGLLGVSSHKDGGFVSEIRRDGKRTYLGYFKTAQEAHDAYMRAKERD